MRYKVGTLVALLWSTSGLAQVEQDWGATLRRDAQALHDAYMRDHPGAVDKANPRFGAWLTAGLVQVQNRARATLSYPAYWWALREYIAGFNDGHVFVEPGPNAPQLSLRWPGFLTRHVGDRHIVAVSDGETSSPPIGSELASCDSVSADQLSSELVGRFRGRWNMAGQHEAHGWRLFLDAANPFVGLPQHCTFRVGGEERSYGLRWKSLSQEELTAHSPRLMREPAGRIGMRRFGQHSLWVTLSSFTSDPSAEAPRELDKVVAGLRSDPAKVRDADVIVLDVRGNGGGSSAWGQRIAAALWGEANASAAKPVSAAVEWRVSEANAQAIERLGQEAGGRTRIWSRHIGAGIRGAMQQGKSLWRETPVLGGLLGRLILGKSGAGRIDPAGFLVRGRVYILTDGGCASACLDAMDVWTRLGAIPIGRETGADSAYMEIRRQPLPSGIATVSIPMKVYRSRERGPDQSHKPVHVLEGWGATAAQLEAWVLSLRN